MNERLDRKVCDTQDSGDHIVVRYHGSYGTSSILPSDYNDNSVGCNMFVLDALHHEDHKDGLLREDCIQKQDKIPWLYVEGPGPTSHYDGTEPDKPPINAEFNDFAERKAKGLVNDPGASWIFVVSEGIVVEVTSDVSYGQLGIIEKTKKNKKNRKKKR
ncbi:unnamed protein product [Rhizophagus irregularis]|nr:unnamed protein product [Rhizophagus irregularis]